MMSDFYDFDNENSHGDKRNDLTSSTMDPESVKYGTETPALSDNLELTDFDKDVIGKADYRSTGTDQSVEPSYQPLSSSEEYRSSQSGSGYTGGQDSSYGSSQSGSGYTGGRDSSYRSSQSGSGYTGGQGNSYRSSQTGGGYTGGRDSSYRSSQTGDSHQDQGGRNVTMENPYGSKYSSRSGSGSGTAAPENNGRYSYRSSGGKTGGSGGGPNGPNGPDYNHYSKVPDDSGNRRRKKGSPILGFVKLVASALIFGIIAGATMVGVNKLSGNSSSGTTSQKIETTTDSADSKDSGSSGKAVTGTDKTVSQVVQQVMPSVVSITGTYQTQSFFGFDSGEQQGAGSGFIIAQDDKSIMIATNNHVVQDSTQLTVGFIDGKTVAATIVGTDSEADLAVIAVKTSDLEKETLSKIKVAVLGDSDSLEVGQTVIAIGNALGYGQSVTTGVISAKDREVSFTDGTMTLLQTDAAINPGNSGGVLCDTNGKVIGINNAKLEDTSVEGMCYAIPITTANTILTDLMNAENIDESEASYLGIVGKTIDSSTSAALGMPSGVYVSQVVQGSPAETAGISAGDVITAFNGNNVSTMDGLKSKLSAKAAGTEITLTIQRANQNGEYEKKDLKVTLGKKSDYETETTENQQQNPQQDQQQNGNSDNGQGIDPYEYFFGNGDGNGNNNGNGYNNGNGNGNNNGNGNDGSQNDGSGSDNPFEYFFNNYGY